MEHTQRFFNTINSIGNAENRTEFNSKSSAARMLGKGVVIQLEIRTYIEQESTQRLRQGPWRQRNNVLGTDRTIPKRMQKRQQVHHGNGGSGHQCNPRQTTDKSCRFQAHLWEQILAPTTTKGRNGAPEKRNGRQNLQSNERTHPRLMQSKGESGLTTYQY